jgi:hypothetical protein
MATCCKNTLYALCTAATSLSVSMHAYNTTVMVSAVHFSDGLAVILGAESGPAPLTSVLTGEVHRLTCVFGRADIVCWP